MKNFLLMCMVIFLSHQSSYGQDKFREELDNISQEIFQIKSKVIENQRKIDKCHDSVLKMVYIEECRKNEKSIDECYQKLKDCMKKYLPPEKYEEMKKNFFPEEEPVHRQEIKLRYPVKPV